MRALIDKENTVNFILQKSREMRGTYGDLGSACREVAKFIENMIPVTDEVIQEYYKRSDLSNDNE